MYLHGILPVGHMVSRYGPTYEKHCETCGYHDEDVNHLVRCPAETRRKWRLQTHRNLRKKMEKEFTDQHLADIALEGMMSHLEDRQFLLLGHPKPLKYYRLIAEQHSIGWDNFLKGRWSKEWGRLQEEHLKATGRRTERCNGDAWATNMITTIWTDWFELWEMRNGDRHGKTDAEKNEAVKAQLVREVEELYKSAGDVHPDDVDIFEMPIEELTAKTASSIFSWKANWEPAIRMSIDRRIREQRGEEIDGEVLHDTSE